MTRAKGEQGAIAGAGVESEAPARLERRDGVAWLTIDLPGKRVNTLSSGFMTWFEERVGELEEERPRGLIIASGKADTFVAGADIEELEALEDPSEVRELLRRGHALFQRIADLPLPVVMAIHGSCLGGGLELALTADWRVATDHPKTRLGLPEVQLGLIPGLGGTQRLPRLIGVPNALDLILTGRQVKPRRARRLGLVDEVCHPADLETAALRLLERGERRKERATGGQSLVERAGDVLARTRFGDRWVYSKARQGVIEKTGGHYPAPLEAVAVVQEGIRLPLERALEREADTFVELVVSDVAKSLMGIFFMKNEVDRRSARLAEQGRDLDRVGVLGAGLMGAGIAQVLSYRGVQVALKDRDHDALSRGMKYCRQRFAELVARRRYREADLRKAMQRLHPTVEYESFRHLPLVIEAVFEDLEVKHQVIREVEEVAPEGLIFASNTSAIPIAELARASRRPENVVGMHFFSPVHKMPLVEVVRHPGSSQEAAATTVRLGREMGKTIIVVEDGPGFFTTRILAPFVNEAVWCLAQGARIEEVDAALEGWGWPVGPLTLLDEVGIDVGVHAAKVMREHLGDRFDPPPAFEHLVDDRRLGRKSDRGFYRYEKGKKGGPDESIYPLIGWRREGLPDREIVERCWLQMLNEVARTIEDGVIENPVDIDIGVIFGLGFPPFRGGILRHADRVGLPWVVERLEHYSGRHGKRLQPARLLQEMAAQGRRFHS